MDKDNRLAVRLRFPDGTVGKLYEDGGDDGLPEGTLVLNYVPLLLDALRADVILKDREIHTLRTRTDATEPQPMTLQGA